MNGGATDQTSLQRLDLSELTIGQNIPGAIREHTGRVLLRAGRLIEASDLKLLERFNQRGVFVGPEWCASCPDQDEPPQSPPADPDAQAPQDADAQDSRPSQDEIISLLANVREGQGLARSIYAKDGTLLLAAGVEVHAEHLDRLRREGICALTRPNPPAPVARRVGRVSNRARLSEVSIPRELPRGRRAPAHRNLPLDDFLAETQRATEVYAKSIDHVEEIAIDIHRGRCSSVRAAQSVIATFLEMVSTDTSLLPTVITLHDSPNEYLFQHGMNVALLSMTAAANLGLAQESILDIGVGALLQDVGMLRVPYDLRMAPRGLTDRERMEIARHPSYTLDDLERLENLSKTSMLIAYQSHERVDGSGYPHRKHRTFIHPYAQLVAAADTYAAIVMPRPHRSARSPYEAMETLLRQASRNQIDPEIVRNFLDCMSLFPVGSYVRLSDGTVGKVLRANPGQHTKPSILLLKADGTESDIELDLSRVNDICVTQALRSATEASIILAA